MIRKIAVYIDVKDDDLTMEEFDEYLDAVETACLNLALRAHVGGAITVDVRDATDG